MIAPETLETIKSLFELGGVIVVTGMLWVVWQRLNDVTDKLIDILAELRFQSLNLTHPGTTERKQP